MDPSSSVAAENPMDETAPLETDEEFDEETDEEFDEETDEEFDEETDEEELDRKLEEQHEEWLRTKVPLKTAEELEEWVLMMSDKITPIEFEPRGYWDPEDSTTWKNYPEANPRFLLPNRDSQTPGDEIDGAFVFELYSIEVTKLDLKSTFSPIAMACRGTDYKRVVIYNHPNGEEVILNEPLPLKGPFRLASADSFVSLHFGPGWGYAADDQTFSSQQTKRDTPLYMSVEDFEIDSQVLFSYELITLAVKAEVVFRFLGEEKEYPIRIISGIIFATNDGDSRTKRIIKSFSSVPVLSNKELENEWLPEFLSATSDWFRRAVLHLYWHNNKAKCSGALVRP